MNLADLQKEAHAIAKDHGWWDAPRTFGDLIALVHSELSEALEAYRENPTMGTSLHNPPEAGGSTVVGSRFLVKPEGVASELADVVIRVADMAEWYGVVPNSIEVTGELPELPTGRKITSFCEAIAGLHFTLSGVLETYWASDGDVWDLAGPLHHFIGVVCDTAAHYGIDLDAAIEAKMEYNRTREYRHGGKAL